MKLKVFVARSCDSLQPHAHAHQAPLSMELSRSECWSGQPFPSPGDLLNPGIEPRSPSLQVHSLPSELPGKPHTFILKRYSWSIWSPRFDFLYFSLISMVEKREWVHESTASETWTTSQLGVYARVSTPLLFKQFRMSVTGTPVHPVSSITGRKGAEPELTPPH